MIRKYNKYTNAQKNFLLKHIYDMSYKELTLLFNKTFGTNVSVYSISDLCTKRLKIKRCKNEGRFFVGQIRSSANVGTTVLRSGYLYIKTNSIRHNGKTTYSDMKENWMPYQRYVYEQKNGKVPEGGIVIFLDGNKNNFDIENLYCINRKIACVMNKNRWFSSDRNATLAAIKWCELFYAMQSAR